MLALRTVVEMVQQVNDLLRICGIVLNVWFAISGVFVHFVQNGKSPFTGGHRSL
jgi:uncharacterized membrane protein